MGARPLLSFILVVHREQAFLEACTASLLADASELVELVAIDDASPDHAPELLDGLAERDARVRVHHLPERAGLGAARNVALEHATGEYVWFVAATDLLAPGAVARVAAQLRADAPDVLVVQHERSDPLAEGRPGPHRKILARVAERGPGPLELHPELADAAAPVWDKVIRREHLLAVGARFRGGAHSDPAVTWPALLAAERIAGTPVAAYVRRRPGNAVADPLAAGTPFDALDAYDEVLASAPEERRRLVLPAAVRHWLALLDALPEDERRDFFHRASEILSRHAGGDEPAAKRLARIRRTLVERDRYTAYGLLENALAARRAVKSRTQSATRLGRRVGKRVRREQRRRQYRARRRQPVDPQLAVYAAYWYRGYSCNPRAIYEKARELAPGVRGVWVVKPGAAGSIPEGVEHVVAGTPEYHDVMARAGYFINNVNFPNDFVKRPGTVHVMTHHGTPLKYMGLDLRASPLAAGRMDFELLMRRCRRWDYSISANPFSTLIWERVYPLPYESLEVGYPRNDALVNASEEDVRRIRAELGIAPDRQAVLYAPTHREYRSGYFPVLDIGAVADALGPDHVLLARLHYFYDADPVLRELHRAGRVRDVAAHPSVEELCMAADVLVTDYSSIMFDYAVLDRPIVIHAPDWEVYRATRGTYFDLMSEPPGVVTRTEGELVDALRSGAAADEARAAFRARFCSLEDGKASERVVRRVLLGEREAAAPRAVSLA